MWTINYNLWRWPARFFDKVLTHVDHSLLYIANRDNFNIISSESEVEMVLATQPNTNKTQTYFRFGIFT